jgi:hypothetical protein
MSDQNNEARIIRFPITAEQRDAEVERRINDGLPSGGPDEKITGLRLTEDFFSEENKFTPTSRIKDTISNLGEYFGVNLTRRQALGLVAATSLILGGAVSHNKFFAHDHKTQKTEHISHKPEK